MDCPDHGRIPYPAHPYPEKHFRKNFSGSGNSDAKSGKHFQKKIAPPLTDDHTYINQIAKIPVIDIIHYDIRPYTGRFDFGHFHHTHADNMEIIHKPTLKAVGQTVLNYLYNQ